MCADAVPIIFSTFGTLQSVTRHASFNVLFFIFKFKSFTPVTSIEVSSDTACFKSPTVVDDSTSTSKVTFPHLQERAVDFDSPLVEVVVVVVVDEEVKLAIVLTLTLVTRNKLPVKLIL